MNCEFEQGRQGHLGKAVGLVTVATFRGFYEELLAMAREGMPAALIEQKIRQRIPDRENRKPLLAYLRDSQDALDAEGKDEAAATLGQVIKALEEREGR